jgi:gamma-glutamyltranspeptidase
MPAGAVAAAHPIAMKVGRDVLAAGGNAYDATLAVSAALTVALPHANGVGSDFFALIRDRGIRAVNASGPAATLATPERFRTEGLSTIPDRGPLASFMVPGLVSAWTFLIERAHLRPKDLFGPAIRWARDGVPVTPQLAEAIRGMRGADAEWQAIYGSTRVGGRLRQTSLGRTLERIAEDSGHGFYHGELAREIERDMIAKGGLLRATDLDAYAIRVTDPFHVPYRGYRVYTTPPNSQGATALIWLNLLARDDLANAPPRNYASRLVETARVAYAYRRQHIGDPDRVPFPAELLDPGFPYAEEVLPSSGAVAAGGDTTAFSVFDGEIGVSAIQSNFKGFGSGHTVAGTGINLNDRGSYFTLEPGHHNVLAPQKRTFHTLMATMAVGPATLLLGTMGGDVQPQVVVQVLTRVLDRQESLPAAIAAPRFAWPATIYASAELLREPGFPCADGRLEPNAPAEFGHCQGIWVGDRLEKGIDPRGEGLLPLVPIDGDRRTVEKPRTFGRSRCPGGP